MNCSEFRRRLMIDPNRREEQFLAHLAQCPECARETQRIRELDRMLLTALAAEPAVEPAVESRRWALAASLMLSLGLSAWLGIQWGLYPGMQPKLSEVVLEHIENEPDALQLDRNLSATTVALMLSGLGARLTADPGPIRYMGRCQIGERQGLHLVVAGKRGPVTVLLMPGEHVSERQPLDSISFSGVIVPTDYGSMAMVGARREPVEGVMERMQRAVAWGPAATAL